jgi:hypothetical protein
LLANDRADSRVNHGEPEERERERREEQEVKEEQMIMMMKSADSVKRPKCTIERDHSLYCTTSSGSPLSLSLSLLAQFDRSSSS